MLLAACAHQPVARSPITLNSGIPLSDGLKSYDVEHYTLRNDILTSEKAITGSSDITFRAVHPMSVLELDFDGLYAIDEISDSDGQLDYTRDAAKIYIALRNELTVGDTQTVSVAYHGQPLEAERAPWDGGFVWSETPSGKPWVATAIQGEGCDLWWPCKDHLAGEPEGMDLYFTVAAHFIGAPKSRQTPMG